MYRIVDSKGTEVARVDSLDEAIKKACDLDCEAIMLGNFVTHFVEEVKEGGENK